MTKNVTVLCFVTLAALVLAPHIWRNYVFIDASLEQDYAACDVEGDRRYGLDASRWRDEHRFGLSAFNRAEADFIKSCMIKAGWIYRIKDDSDPLGCGVWCYGPRDPIAMWLFDRRHF